MPQQTPHAASCTVGIGPAPGILLGGASWQQTGQCGLSSSPLLEGEVGQGPVGRRMCPSHHMGGCDCAQDGGGIGWHDQGHKRRL